MNSGSFSFLAYGLTLFGALGMAISCAEDTGGQLEPREQAVRFRLRGAYDVGHGGSIQEFTLERAKGKFFVKFQELRNFPRPGEKDFKPVATSRTEERTTEEAERFLHMLVNEIDIEKLKDLKARVLLHPSSYDFEMRYADGRVHTFAYVIEADHHLDDKYRRLVSACEEFFGIR